MQELIKLESRDELAPESSSCFSFSFGNDGDDRSMPSMRSPIIRPIITLTALQVFQYVLLVLVGIQ